MLFSNPNRNYNVLGYDWVWRPTYGTLRLVEAEVKTKNTGNCFSVHTSSPSCFSLTVSESACFAITEGETEEVIPIEVDFSSIITTIYGVHAQGVNDFFIYGRIEGHDYRTLFNILITSRYSNGAIKNWEVYDSIVIDRATVNMDDVFLMGYDNEGIEDVIVYNWDDTVAESHSSVTLFKKGEWGTSGGYGFIDKDRLIDSFWIDGTTSCGGGATETNVVKITAHNMYGNEIDTDFLGTVAGTIGYRQSVRASFDIDGKKAIIKTQSAGLTLIYLDCYERENYLHGSECISSWWSDDVIIVGTVGVGMRNFGLYGSVISWEYDDTTSGGDAGIVFYDTEAREGVVKIQGEDIDYTDYTMRGGLVFTADGSTTIKQQIIDDTE